MEGCKLHNSMNALDCVGDSQVSHSADTKSESNSNSTSCTSSSSTNTLSVLDHLRVPTLLTLGSPSCAYSIDISVKVKENNNYKSMRENYAIMKKGIVP